MDQTSHATTGKIAAQIIILAHNIRSTHNIGSIFRTAEGFGVHKIYLTGYTPYPIVQGDTRPPHIRSKIDRQIAKTALGAEKLVRFEVNDNPSEIIAKYRTQHFTVAALEQTIGSVQLSNYTPPDHLLLVLGEEVAGVPQELLTLCDLSIEIPMRGAKESFNVSVAAGIALYALTESSTPQSRNIPQP